MRRKKNINIQEGEGALLASEMLNWAEIQAQIVGVISAPSAVTVSL